MNDDELQTKANAWDKLKALAGHVQNGSDVVIKLFQDDATRSYWIIVGGKSNFGNSFEEALKKFEVTND